VSDLVRLSMSIEEDLFEALERLVQKSGYTNRSEFIRDLIRRRFVEEQWHAGKRGLATVTIVYDHHIRGLTEKLIALQHRYVGKMLGTLHLHVGEHRCAEVVVLRGNLADVRAFADAVGSLRGVRHTAVALTTADKALH